MLGNALFLVYTAAGVGALWAGEVTASAGFSIAAVTGLLLNTRS